MLTEAWSTEIPGTRGFFYDIAVEVLNKFKQRIFWRWKIDRFEV